ncbi:MAG: PQQ-binding-like beta-propeller repeat protein [Solirubrobacterales bacterium]|nr:PQQ-binding-like beta-propeller repeat protein [Solirubrobacterales bacterium]
MAVDTEDVSGYLSAIDPATGQEKWRHRNDHPMTASVLTTAGDLVFAGDPAGILRAWNATSGDLLWEFLCGSGHHSSLSTYIVDGQQFLAVPVGYGAWTEGFYPGALAQAGGSAVFAFALPE